MAIAKRIFTIINFMMIMEQIATYPRQHDKANENTLYTIRKYEANNLITPSMRTKRDSYTDSTANDLAPPLRSTIHNHNNLNDTTDLHYLFNPIDQMLTIYAKDLIRDSLKVMQNQLRSGTAPASNELFDILQKIKNLSKADEALVAIALYNTIETLNEVSADLTSSWRETIREQLEQLLEQERQGVYVTDIAESLIVVDDIERNFDAVRLFWLKL